MKMSSEVLGRFPSALSDRSDQYFLGKNDGFKKGNHFKMVGSDLEKIVLILDSNILQCNPFDTARKMLKHPAKLDWPPSGYYDYF